MPLPSMTMITLRATYLKLDGEPEIGRVTVRSHVFFQNAGDNVISPSIFEVVEVDEEALGLFELPVPATNDPQWGPLNWVYEITEQFSTGTRQYQIAVPHDTPGGVLELANVAPVVNAPDPQTYVLVAQGNVANGYAKLGADAKIEYSVLPDEYVTLTDAATIAVDASLGTRFRVTLGGNRILGNPTNPPAAGRVQLALFAIRQDGAGNRTLTLDSKYRFGTGIPSITLSTGPNKTDYLGVCYNQVDDMWDVIAFTKGF